MPHSTREKPKARSNTINTVYKEAPLTGGFLISNAGAAFGSPQDKHTAGDALCTMKKGRKSVPFGYSTDIM